MANVKGPSDHSSAIEKLAAKKLQDPNADRDTKRLAGAVLAHADGRTTAKSVAKPVARPAAKVVAKPAAKATPKPAAKKPAKPPAKPAPKRKK